MNGFLLQRLTSRICGRCCQNRTSESTDNLAERVAPQTLFARTPGRYCPELHGALQKTSSMWRRLARAGYIGTVGGVRHLHHKKDFTEELLSWFGCSTGSYIFNKKGVRVWGNNGDIIRHYLYVVLPFAALTDATRQIKILKGTATGTRVSGVHGADSSYIVGKPKTNPKTEGFYGAK